MESAVQIYPETRLKYEAPKCVLAIVMNGGKIPSMVLENLHFLDSLNYFPMSRKSMPESFDLTLEEVLSPLL